MYSNKIQKVTVCLLLFNFVTMYNGQYYGTKLNSEQSENFSLAIKQNLRVPFSINKLMIRIKQAIIHAIKGDEKTSSDKGVLMTRRKFVTEMVTMAGLISSTSLLLNGCDANRILYEVKYVKREPRTYNKIPYFLYVYRIDFLSPIMNSKGELPKNIDITMDVLDKKNTRLDGTISMYLSKDGDYDPDKSYVDKGEFKPAPNNTVRIEREGLKNAMERCGVKEIKQITIWLPLVLFGEKYEDYKIRSDAGIQVEIESISIEGHKIKESSGSKLSNLGSFI